jgi:hypothetical protein
MNPRLTLHRYKDSKVRLVKCVAEIAPTLTLTGWCATPQRLFCVSVDAHGWRDHLGQPMSAADAAIAQVYEACLFHPEPGPFEVGALLTTGGELRWLRDPETDGVGRAAWASERDSCPSGFTELPRLVDLTALDQIATPDGTVSNRVLTQTRGRLPGIAVGTRAAWRLREYIGPAPAPAGDQGNRVIVARRLIGIDSLPSEETGQ